MKVSTMYKAMLLMATALFYTACSSDPASTDSIPTVGFSGNVVDLTYTFDSESIFWPTAEGFVREATDDGFTEKGYYYYAGTFRLSEHGGTHIDAPIHFGEGQLTLDQLPLEQLMGPAIVVDVSEKAGGNRDYEVSVEDFEAWEATHGVIEDGTIILLQTGNGQYWPDRERYMGTAERGADAVAKLHFPGLHPDAARWLVEHRSINAIGLDTPSIDYGQSQLFEAHQILYAENIPAIENVANLDLLPANGFTVIALPMKIKDGSGGPLRIIALVP